MRYPTAWLLHHKINSAMSHQEAARLLSGAVQLDDTYLGGERSGGKPGRGSENQAPPVAAVSMYDGGQLIRLKLDRVSGFTSEAIARWAKTSLLPKAIVISDGPGCFAAVTNAGCIRMPRVAGAFKALKYRKCAQTYPGAFAYRVNHRFDLRQMIAVLTVDATQTKLTAKRVTRGGHAESDF